MAVEPDEANQEVLEQRFLKYRLNPRPVVIVGKAVSDRNAVETMWVDAPGSAKNTLSQKWVDVLRSDEKHFGHRLSFAHKKEVETIVLDQLIREYGVPCFVKIDVEGYEPSVLRGLSVPVPYLSFEVNLPEFKREGLECIDILEHKIAGGKFNYSADCRKGLVFPEWLEARDFLPVFNACKEQCIEVFWRTSATIVGHRTLAGAA